MTAQQIRIDRAYEKIYEYSKEHDAYLFYCSFAALGLDKKMSDKKIRQTVLDDMSFDLN